MSEESPFNAIPAAPLMLFLALFGVELAVSAAAQGFVGGQQGIGWRIALFDRFAFAPSVLDIMVERGIVTVDLAKRLITYPVVHASFTHTLWASVLLLALGKFVGEAYGSPAFLAVFGIATVFGALIYGAVAPGNMPLVGAYPGIYGLIGAYTYVLWLQLGQVGENQYRAFTLIGILMGLTLIYSIFFGANPWWIAELSGFVIGLAVAPLVAPGGWSAFIARLRRR